MNCYLLLTFKLIVWRDHINDNVEYIYFKVMIGILNYVLFLKG